MVDLGDSISPIPLPFERQSVISESADKRNINNKAISAFLRSTGHWFCVWIITETVMKNKIDGIVDGQKGYSAHHNAKSLVYFEPIKESLCSKCK